MFIFVTEQANVDFRQKKGSPQLNTSILAPLFYFLLNFFRDLSV